MFAAKVIKSKPIIKRLNSLMLVLKESQASFPHEEVVSFLKNNFKSGQISGFYFDEFLENFIIKLNNDCDSQSYDGRVYIHEMHNGSKQRIVLLQATDFVHTVRLFNLPLEISEHMIRSTLAEYGMPISVAHEYSGSGEWRLPNGNRVVKMLIFDSLPLKLCIAGMPFKLFCSSLQRVCFVCGHCDHEMANCSEQKSTSLSQSLSSEDPMTANLLSPKQKKVSKVAPASHSVIEPNRCVKVDVKPKQTSPNDGKASCSENGNAVPKKKKKTRSRSQADLERWCVESKGYGKAMREIFRKARKDSSLRRQYLQIASSSSDYLVQLRNLIDFCKETYEESGENSNL